MWFQVWNWTLIYINNLFKLQFVWLWNSFFLYKTKSVVKLSYFFYWNKMIAPVCISNRQILPLILIIINRALKIIKFIIYFEVNFTLDCYKCFKLVVNGKLSTRLHKRLNWILKLYFTFVIKKFLVVQRTCLTVFTCCPRVNCCIFSHEIRSGNLCENIQQ